MKFTKNTLQRAVTVAKTTYVAGTPVAINVYKNGKANIVTVKVNLKGSHKVDNVSDVFNLSLTDDEYNEYFL